jgi:hypothetical protein
VNKLITALAVLVVMALAPATALGAQSGTDRPLRFISSGTGVVNIATLTYTQDETSLVSHLGRCHTVGSGAVIPTGPNTFELRGSYTTTAANGDKLFVNVNGTNEVDPATGVGVFESLNTITGGTGRFRGASGTFSGTSAPAIVAASEGNLILKLSGESTGTISY